MMRRINCLMVLTVISGILNTACQATSTDDTITIQGYISNFNNSPISNILVYIGDAAENQSTSYSTYSGSNGFYSISEPAGHLGTTILYDDTNYIYSFITTNINISLADYSVAETSITTNINIIMTNG